ncbi:AAA family ATPase [Bacillus pumilus]|uniref:ATP-dependent nuclease n=1 Tax=Bacillus pumilus TaxID=1408 RepID=UPI00228213D8|nr:AAA family ATPase [Bacillus pumilus]MCY7433760.1 AAA family ATPase [Bacillus pumilus]
MYLSSLKLWNWRKFSESTNGEAGIDIEFNDRLNILVGENDAGKTAIIDAIKTALGTNSNDVNWITEQDFYEGKTKLKIECIFQALSVGEESYFYEWITFNEQETELRVVMEAEFYEDLNSQRKIRKSIKAGPEDMEISMDETVRKMLSVTYLKPLRDANSELSSGRKSRITQVIKSLKDFANDSLEQQQIIENFSQSFDELKQFLNEPVLKKIGITIDEFFEENNKKVPEIKNREMGFAEILRKLELNLGELGTGLGSSNLLFMAVELLLLSDGIVGPKLALIEEIEAHIHPQAQLRVIRHFEKNAIETGMQYIFSSHSPVLAASVELESIIFIYNQSAFPMKKGQTKLEAGDYEFLERFLDAKKANLFFARGVILVEGDAENLLLPAIAELISRPLYKYGVSIVNVGSLAFKRYSTIFLRENQSKLMNFPVSIITDLDLKPVEFYERTSYIKVDEEINRQIASYYEVEEINIELNGIYIQISDIVIKSKTLYGSIIKKLPQEEQKVKMQGIEVLIEQLLESEQPHFIEYLTQSIMEIKDRYFHDNEATKVFISEPWTLEHSIAASDLGDEFENVLLDCHYKERVNRQTQKKLWEAIDNPVIRANNVYSFLLEKKISKSILAQQFAKYLIDNKEALKEKLANGSLKHLVEAVKHVTGGE